MHGLEQKIFCRQCGMENGENNYKCVRCGFILHAPSPPPLPSFASDDNSLGGLIPYKNKWGLLAYYFGIFSILPMIGLPLGIAGFIFGIKGVALARRNPEAKGAVHAWVGSLMGGFLAIVYGLLAVILLGSMLTYS